MKLTRLFTKEATPGLQQQLIRDEMMFLLEPNERRFEKHLRAHLLDEVCNFPILLAKPQFYESMLSGLLAKASPSIQKKFHQEMSFFHKITPQHDIRPLQKNDRILHEEFYTAMRFFAAKLESSGKQMALEVLNSVEIIKGAWQLDKAIFQKELKEFDAYLWMNITRLWETRESDLFSERIAPELVRRRLYITLTTSLLSKMNVRNAFETEFGSIPELLKAMQADHAAFSRFMRFCQERSPYFILITSQTFWRTLETLCTESRS